MATLDELRERSDTLFTGLLKAQATPVRRSQDATGAAAPELPSGSFSWFDPHDAVAAAALSFRLAALAASGETDEHGLARR